jgi:hypothetical protein
LLGLLSICRQRDDLPSAEQAMSTQDQEQQLNGQLRDLIRQRLTEDPALDASDVIIEVEIDNRLNPLG